MNDEVLRGYLQHHWVGSTAGAATFRRVGRHHRDPGAAAEVRHLASEVASDREALRRIMRSVGIHPSVVGTVLARLGELLGRLKPNGRLFTRSPLTDVVELEALQLAVTGKRASFEVLRAGADEDRRLDAHEIDRLLDRAYTHQRTLDRLHVQISRERLVAEAPSR